MRYARRAVVGASIVVAIPAVSPARAATYRFRTALQVRQDTTWSSSRDDAARGATSGCFGTSSGSGTQRVTFTVPFTLALRDAHIGARQFLDLILPRRFVHLTATVTRNGQLTFSPDPRSTTQCNPEVARTDGCGTHRYGLDIFPSYGRLYGTRGRNIEVLDIFNVLGPLNPPFNDDSSDYANPSCPYWGLLPSWNADLDWNLDEAWRLIRTGQRPSISAILRKQYFPASRVHNGRVLRTVTRNGITLNQRFIGQSGFETSPGQPGRSLGQQDNVTAQTIQTVTWTMRRIP
jgi:hypothetical protein